MVNVIKGNLITLADEGRFDVIIQQANCFNTMGAGFAYFLKQRWPVVYEVDCQTIRGDKTKLGTYSIADVKTSIDTDLKVVNLYSQYDFARSYGDVATDYDAMKKGFESLSREFSSARIGIPFGIGCGLANGDWKVVSDLIETCFQDNVVTIVKLV